MSNRKNIQLKKSIILFTICVASAITYSQFGGILYTQDDVETYMKLDDVISAHQGEKLYLGMNATQYLLNEDLWEPDEIYFNDGQIEYFNGNYLEGSIINNLFYDEEIKNAAAGYVSRVNNLLADKEFGLVATCIDSIIDKETLERNYYIYNNYSIKTETNGCLEVTVWLPLK